MCSFHKLELSTCHKVKLEFKTLRSEPVPTHSWNVFVCGHFRSTLIPEVFLNFSPYKMRSREAASGEFLSRRLTALVLSSRTAQKSRITLWDQGIFGGVSLHFAKSFQVYFNPLSQRDSCICLSVIIYHG